MNTKTLCVNSLRFLSSLSTISQFGATPEGGVHRPAFSEAHLEARRWFLEQATQAGLEVRVDGAGNHSARLACPIPDAPTLLLGSHLDSVPNGGRFDGALGVICALEVLRTVQDAGLTLPVHLEAIDLSDEEGAHISLLGSRALTGKLRPDDLAHPHIGRDDFSLALQRAGLTLAGISSARRSAESLAGYLEVHIEQGPRLINAGFDIGVVTHIVGIRWYQLRFLGRADHSGTMPVNQRRDAAQGAAAFTLAVREIVLDQFADCVANVGNMQFLPGAFNVVPQEVELALECRAPTAELVQSLCERLLDVAKEQALRFDLKLEVQPLEAIAPTPMDERGQQVIAEAARMLRLRSCRISSGAGHDAQSLADLCPTGMIFVPSVDGRSHSPREFSHDEDCVNGANVLLQATLAWAEC